jgi:two-component sensor histidine kinase/CHASE1-domain containing sensor protein
MVMTVTVLSVFTIERGEEQRDVADVNRRAQAMSSAIERRAFTGASYLRAGAALLTTQPDVSRSLFERFVTELRLDTDYRGADGIGWAPVLRPDQVAAFEEQLAGGGTVRARLRPSLAAQPRDTIVPVLFLQPDTLRNRRALGYDMYSEPVRRAAMDEAERTARPTASGRVVLVQEGGEQDAGFLIYMPVFGPEAGANTLKGFIYSPINAENFLESAGELVSFDKFAARLYDMADGKRTLIAELPGWRDDGLAVERRLVLAGRPMLLVVQSARDGALSTMSMVTLLFGLAVASLLMFIARLLTQQAMEDGRALDRLIEQNSIRDSLTRELNHRVKNTLANVLSIVALTRRRANNLDDFAEGVDARIRALSATHDLLTQSEWGTTPLRSVVEVELAPYTHDDDHRVALEGPVVELAPNDALSLGLALHELATNAAKFGSLSVVGGAVSVTWSLDGTDLARIEWAESNGPPVTEPAQRGFGTELIEKIVAHELRHPVELAFDKGGVRCTLLVPVRRPGEFALREKYARTG